MDATADEIAIPAAEAPAVPAARAKAPSRWKKRVIMAALAVAAVAATARFVVRTLSFVSTDNATVQAHTTMLSARVGGLIVKSEVEENQHVKAGAILVEIRPDDYRHTLAQSAADLRTVRAELAGAERTLSRIRALHGRGSATQEELESAETKAAQLSAHAEAVKAQVEQALLNLDYTKIVAPADGTVGRRSAEVGMYATPGQPLLGFVADSERWVVANFKETDLAHVRIGQKAQVKVDALPGQEFEGEVESISPSTGAMFSLLPPDNATGNFTKVVQRVPVRVKLNGLDVAAKERLAPGLSAEVEIRYRSF